MGFIVIVQVRGGRLDVIRKLNFGCQSNASFGVNYVDETLICEGCAPSSSHAKT